ncbi:MAG TPA: hypothetical protein VFU22_09655 [Roseiflexaceae bacterium]|nr:hypothetical protein [Roseiflexaceae bacterium]
MITTKTTEALVWNCGQNTSGWAAGKLEVPAELLAEQSDLLDRVFAFAFDVLGLHTLDLRIRPYAECVATPTSGPVARGPS